MQQLSVADVLSKAADLIEPEGAWTRGWSARDGDGLGTWALDDDAVCWCAVGAIIRAAGEESATSDKAISRIFRVVDAPVHVWNDAEGRTQAEVVAALRAAAELAKASS